MVKPEDDVQDRTAVWDVMQDLFMDTDVTLSYELIAAECSHSKYSLVELEQILFNEVLPAFKFNMFYLSAPEWKGYKREWVVERVLAKHKFGQRKPWIFRRITMQLWVVLKVLISAERKEKT